MSALWNESSQVFRVLRGRNSDDQNRTNSRDLDALFEQLGFIIIWRGYQYFIPNNTVSVRDSAWMSVLLPSVAGWPGGLLPVVSPDSIIQNLKNVAYLRHC
jgi:hypothetical protein